VNCDALNKGEDTGNGNSNLRSSRSLRGELTKIMAFLPKGAGCTVLESLNRLWTEAAGDDGMDSAQFLKKKVPNRNLSNSG